MYASHFDKVRFRFRSNHIKPINERIINNDRLKRMCLVISMNSPSTDYDKNFNIVNS